jgi:precorrin-6y C5,15-methyltransferase (decarboxylating) CbiE subunit
MALNRGRIQIIGCGPGSPRYLTDAARQAVAGAEVLVGSVRLLDLFPDHPGRRVLGGADIPALLDEVAREHAAGRSVAVLVSGDPGLFSLGSKVVRRFGVEQCDVVPGVSSVQVAFARLGLDWADARILSAHARLPQVGAEELGRHDKIAILAGSREAVRWAAERAAALRSSHASFLCENLTLDDERVRPVTPDDLASAEAASLAIILYIRRES